MKLIKDLIKFHDDRKEWHIIPKFGFVWDSDDYCFSFLPTIVWTPWVYRPPNFYVVEFWWLNFHICFGIWERKE